MGASLVQSNHVGNNASSLNFSSSTTAHNFIVVVVGAYDTTSLTGVTLGGAADNFTQVCAAAQGSTHVWIWVDPDCAGGETAIALQGSNWATDNLSIYEFSGVDAVDRYSSDSGTGTTWSSGTTATTTDANGAWIGICDIDNTTTPPGSPWVTTGDYGYSESSYQLRSSTGTAEYTGTQSSGDWSAAVVTLKITSASANPQPSSVDAAVSSSAPSVWSAVSIPSSTVSLAASIPEREILPGPAMVVGSALVSAPSVTAEGGTTIYPSAVTVVPVITGPVLIAGIMYSSYVGPGGSSGLEGDWSSLSSAEGSASDTFASGTGVT